MSPLDSEPSVVRHRTPERSPNEQTPLLKPGGVPAAGNGTSAAAADTPSSSSSSSTRRRLPDAIAHRGYKVVAPENSMLAFRAAVEAGAHALETDLHLSRDGVVVLAHDGKLKRCFGVDSRVKDHDWDYLSTLRTVRKPEQAMPRLSDLLAYLNQPGLEHVWVVLDIKRDDNPDEIVRRTAETIASVPGIRAWKERIVPCCWTTEYVKITQKYLPGFQIAHVGVSNIYARAIAAHVPNLSVSMLRYLLAMPIAGWRFIRDMKKAGHPIYIWTVNDEDWMEWSIHKEVDGVITDDPKLFLEVCNRVVEKEQEANGQSRKLGFWFPVRSKGDFFDWIRYFPFLLVLMVIYFVRYGLPTTQARKILQG